jgi:hypothetical protein
MTRSDSTASIRSSLTRLQRNELLQRLDALDQAIKKEQQQILETKKKAAEIKAQMHKKQKNYDVNRWKSTHPLAYQSIKMSYQEPPKSDVSLSTSLLSSRSDLTCSDVTRKTSARSLSLTTHESTPFQSLSNASQTIRSKTHHYPHGLNYTPMQFGTTSKSPISTDRTDRAWLSVGKHARRKTIITSIPELQARCSSMLRADGPGHRAVTPTIRHSDITQSVNYVIMPTPFLQPIGKSYPKCLTNLVREREILHENLLPWRKKAV